MGIAIVVRLYLPYLTAYKTHRCQGRTLISAVQIKKKKQSTNIKRDKINIMNVINDGTFDPHNSLLNNDNWYIKVALKSNLIGVAG